MQLRSASGSPQQWDFRLYPVSGHVWWIYGYWRLWNSSFSRVLEQDSSAMIDSYLFLFFLSLPSLLSRDLSSLLLALLFFKNVIPLPYFSLHQPERKGVGFHRSIKLHIHTPQYNFSQIPNKTRHTKCPEIYHLTAKRHVSFPKHKIVRFFFW